MLYILGGAARSGKSTLGRRLLIEKGVPYYSTDALINALQSAETLGIHHELPFIEKGEKLWPLVEPMLGGLLFDEPTYLVDGDGLLPKYIKRFTDKHTDEVRACFLGYPRISVDDKFRDVRTYSTNMDDWTNKETDDYLKKAIADMIAYSQYLQRECQEHSIRFFDTSENFVDQLDDTFAFLSGE